MNITDFIDFKKGVAFLERRGYRTYPVTYKELKEKIQKTESYLKKNSVKKGDRILIQSANSVIYVSLILACFRLGVIVIPLDINASAKLRSKIIKEAAPKLIFTDLNKLSDLIKNLPENKIYPKVSGEDTAEIVYTSGTTNIPKGVILTHKNICSNVKALKEKFNIRIRTISTLPLSHMLEQCCGLFLPLSNNSTILYPNSLRYSDIIDIIRYKKINAMITVPGILEGLKKAAELRDKPIRKLLGWQFRIVGVGGATLPKELEDWWKKRVILLQGYGLTETSPIITMNTFFRHKKYSLGIPMKDVEVKIKDNEILVRGPNVMKGYYKNPENTREVFEDGWFRTGDIGEIKNGFLYFRGRKKDIIVTKAGINIYPEDIETELNKYVKASCIIEKDNNLHAVLITDKSAKDIIEKVNKKLEHHQKIVSYSVWKGDFPRTPTGKIKRYEVEKQFQRQPVKKQESQQHELLSSLLKKEIKNKPLSSLGMDSLKRIEIISMIEEHYGIELDEQDITQHTTIKDLEDLIETKNKISHYNFKLPMLSFIGNAFASMIVSIFCRIKCQKTLFKGIIVANHVSSLDVPVITSCIKTKYAVGALPKYVFGIGSKNIEDKLRGFFVKRFFNVYPFGPEVGLESSLRFTAHLLDEGYSVIFFPEGERTRDGKIHQFKEGIGLLAGSMDAEILSVKTEGLYQILPYNKTLPRFGEVIVKAGKPFKIKNMPSFRATELIEKRVKSL
jgi:long-chain acyl-CoA synthetase